MTKDVKTLTFPNTPEGQAQKVEALKKYLNEGWSLESESISNTTQTFDSTKAAVDTTAACCLCGPVCAPLGLAGTTETKEGQIVITLSKDSTSTSERMQSDESEDSSNSNQSLTAEFIRDTLIEKADTEPNFKLPNTRYLLVYFHVGQQGGLKSFFTNYSALKKWQQTIDSLKELDLEIWIISYSSTKEMYRDQGIDLNVFNLRTETTEEQEQFYGLFKKFFWVTDEASNVNPPVDGRYYLCDLSKPNSEAFHEQQVMSSWDGDLAEELKSVLP